MRRFIFVGICILMLSLLSGCTKESVLPDASGNNSKLKRILLYATVESAKPINIVEEFEYDDSGMISRSSSPMYQDGVVVGTISYKLYEYNSFFQLTRISEFNANINSPTGFINLLNHVYTYSGDGRKEKETITDLNDHLYESYTFEYKHGILTKIKKFNNRNELESYVENEYDDFNRLVKESGYLADGTQISYTVNTYSGMLQVKSDIYKSGLHYREIKRTFNKNGDLIILESNELSGFSSFWGGVLRYEYF
jgi:hypothetical protein